MPGGELSESVDPQTNPVVLPDLPVNVIAVSDQSRSSGWRAGIPFISSRDKSANFCAGQAARDAMER